MKIRRLIINLLLMPAGIQNIGSLPGIPRGNEDGLQIMEYELEESFRKQLAEYVQHENYEEACEYLNACGCLNAANKAKLLNDFAIYAYRNNNTSTARKYINQASEKINDLSQEDRKRLTNNYIKLR